MNPETGKRLELDGYCRKLNLAFEYQGEQHYQTSSLFHSLRGLKEQKKADQVKRELCEKQEITLIEIPIGNHDEMLDEIVQRCKEKNVKIPRIPIELFDYKKVAFGDNFSLSRV